VLRSYLVVRTLNVQCARVFVTTHTHLSDQVRLGFRFDFAVTFSYSRQPQAIAIACLYINC